MDPVPRFTDNHPQAEYNGMHLIGDSRVINNMTIFKSKSNFIPRFD